MKITAEEVIARHALTPHPYEGWSREYEHAEGLYRCFYLLITSLTFVPWHRLTANIEWRYDDGDPVALSTSTDGLAAGSRHLHKQARDPVTVRAGTYQTLETLGSWTLLRGTLSPDISLVERDHCPENWFPGCDA